MTLTQLRYVIEVSRSTSLNEAARNLFISQPSLSASVKELEDEIGLDLFIRSNRGISITPEGEEFLGYARQVVQQYELMESRYIDKVGTKQKFSISTQHYTFAVNAFIKVVQQFGMEDFDFAVYETKTNEIIHNVKNFKSEIGILFLSDFNRQVLTKIFAENGLAFHPLFDCPCYAYIWKGHPLAEKEIVSLKDLEEYPCLAFDQGDANSFYYAEEPYATHEWKQIIRANDRGTMLNLFVGMNGFTLCSGIINEELNGDEYCAVRLEEKETMTIGYIKKKGIPLSQIGQLYVEEIAKSKENVLE